MTELSDLPVEGGALPHASEQGQEQNRDEGGRYAEGQRQPEGDNVSQEPGQGEPQQRQEMVPHQALHAAREEAKGLKGRYDALEARSNEDRAAMLALQRQNMELMQMLRGGGSQPSNQQPQQPPAAPPDFFENPTGAFDHGFQERFKPFREAYDQDRQAALQNHIALSKEVAAVRFGDETVRQAEAWLDATVQANPGMRPVLQQMIFAPGKLPGVEMVRLYQGQTPIGRPQSLDPLVEAEVTRRLAAMGHAPAPQADMPGQVAPPQAAPQPPGQRPAPPQMPTSFASAPNGGPRASSPASGARSLSEIMGR